MDIVLISGAHFNPVVTLVMLLKEITKQEAILFIALQFFGGSYVLLHGLIYH